MNRLIYGNRNIQMSTTGAVEEADIFVVSCNCFLLSPSDLLKISINLFSIFALTLLQNEIIALNDFSNIDLLSFHFLYFGRLMYFGMRQFALSIKKFCKHNSYPRITSTRDLKHNVLVCHIIL